MTLQKIAEIIGKGIVLRGNDIDTDRIIPARFLKETTFANMANYVFYDERFDEKGNKKNHPFNDEKYKDAAILVVNKNFGCGSSREHAPQALLRWGINAIIGESFADIFSGNCRMIGLSTVTISKNGVENLMGFIEKNPDKEVKIDIKNKEISYNEIVTKLEMNNSISNSLINGTCNTVSLLLESGDKIKETITKLPYLNNFE